MGVIGPRFDGHFFVVLRCVVGERVRLTGTGGILLHMKLMKLIPVPLFSDDVFISARHIMWFIILFHNLLLIHYLFHSNIT